MVLKHQQFELLGKVVLERVIFSPPLKAPSRMEDEACFLYSVKGASMLFGGDEKEELDSGEGILMKCGSYLNSWKKSELEPPYEALAVHFYPEILNSVFDQNIPPFLTQDNQIQTRTFQKI